MAERFDNPTDAAICRLLRSAGPLPTAELAARLQIPERTARHRLYRLRQAGAVSTYMDGRHHLAVPAASGPAADRAAPVIDALPAGGSALAAGRAAGSGPATGSDASGPFGGAPLSGLAGAAIVIGLLGLLAVGWLGFGALRRRTTPPGPATPAVPLVGYGSGYLWGGGTGSW